MSLLRTLLRFGPAVAVSFRLRLFDWDPEVSVVFGSSTKWISAFTPGARWNGWIEESGYSQRAASRPTIATRSFSFSSVEYVPSHGPLTEGKTGRIAVHTFTSSCSSGSWAKP